MNDMTPERAQECLEVWGDSLGEVTFNDVRSSFRTLAAMRVEEDYHIANPENNGGKYETVRHTRLVSDWKEA